MKKTNLILFSMQITHTMDIQMKIQVRCSNNFKDMKLAMEMQMREEKQLEKQ